MKYANGPTTPEGDKVLVEKGIELTPDILTNSGGVLVSYYEWVQNQYGYYWTEAEVEEKQEADMMKAIEGVFSVADEYKSNIKRSCLHVCNQINRYSYEIKRMVLILN